MVELTEGFAWRRGAKRSRDAKFRGCAPFHDPHLRNESSRFRRSRTTTARASEPQPSFVSVAADTLARHHCARPESLAKVSANVSQAGLQAKERSGW